MNRLDFNMQRLTPLHSQRSGLSYFLPSLVVLVGALTATMSPCMLGIHPC